MIVCLTFIGIALLISVVGMCFNGIYGKHDELMVGFFYSFAGVGLLVGILYILTH